MAAFTKSARQKSAFDFRFADDEDCEDMAESIAAGYKEEEGRQRSSEALWTGAEIEKDMSEASVKWLLIETPRPEEMVVACARICLDASDRTCSVALLSSRGASDEERQKRFHYLLAKLESVAHSQGANAVAVSVPMWREYEHEWLSSKGYSDVGGDPWPETKASQVLLPALLLRFTKTLRVDGGDGGGAGMLMMPAEGTGLEATGVGALSLAQEIAATAAAATVTSGGGGGAGALGGGMDAIMTDLFSALHAERPEPGSQP